MIGHTQELGQQCWYQVKIQVNYLLIYSYCKHKIEVDTHIAISLFQFLKTSKENIPVTKISTLKTLELWLNHVFGSQHQPLTSAHPSSVYHHCHLVFKFAEV